jgi:ABC-type transport system involved in cytochrome c biogenesis permease subunit
MLEPETITSFTQFGVAGLIGCMWLVERRWAAVREKQVSDLHERIMREQLELRVLVDALKDNTRALTALEAGQRELASALERSRTSREAQSA